MKKLLTVMVVLFFVASLASAQNYISGETYTTARGAGFGVLGYAMDMDDFVIQVLGGLSFAGGAGQYMDNTGNMVDEDADFNLLVGGRWIKGIREGDNANLNIFAGGIFTTDGDKRGGDANTTFEIQAGLQPEYFVTDNVSVSVLMGFNLMIVGKNRGADDSNYMGLGTFADPMANAVVSWYCQ